MAFVLKIDYSNIFCAVYSILMLYNLIYCNPLPFILLVPLPILHAFTPRE